MMKLGFRQKDFYKKYFLGNMSMMGYKKSPKGWGWLDSNQRIPKKRDLQSPYNSQLEHTTLDSLNRINELKMTPLCWSIPFYTSLSWPSA